MSLQWLVERLQWVDPYDAPSEAVEDFWREMGKKGEPPEWPADLSIEDLDQFQPWLNEQELDTLLMYGIEDAGTFLDPEIVKDVWALHFTRARPFHRLSHGARVENLAVTQTGRTVEKVCEDPDVDPEEVFVFAFQLKDIAGQRAQGKFQAARRKYGDNGLLFKVPEAVRAYHTGDDEWQLILPACTEYRSIWIESVEPKHFWLPTLDGGELEFESIWDLVALLDDGDAAEELGLELMVS